MRSFGRVKTRTLSKHQEWLYTTLLPIYLFEMSLDNVSAGAYQEVILEIGFGQGHFLSHQASLHPHKLFVGCEVYYNGVAKLLGNIEEKSLSNVRIAPYPLSYLLPQLSLEMLDTIYILFPDPWPKLKQHKRRIINLALFLDLTQLMKEGASICIMTDCLNYFEQIIATAINCPDLRIVKCIHNVREQFLQQTYSVYAHKAQTTCFYLEIVKQTQRSLETSAKRLILL